MVMRLLVMDMRSWERGWVDAYEIMKYTLVVCIGLDICSEDSASQVLRSALNVHISTTCAVLGYKVSYSRGLELQSSSSHISRSAGPSSLPIPHPVPPTVKPAPASGESHCSFSRGHKKTGTVSAYLFILLLLLLSGISQPYQFRTCAFSVPDWRRGLGKEQGLGA